MILETLIVHPLERFQIPGSKVNDFTLAHWYRFSSVRVLTPSFITVSKHSDYFWSLIFGVTYRWRTGMVGGPHYYAVKEISNWAVVPVFP